MIDRLTGPDGAIEERSLFAAAFEAIFISFCEPTSPFADLTQY